MTFAGLAEATGHDDVYRTITACGDLHMLLGQRHPPECLRLDRKAPRAWVDCGNFENDLADAVEQWADYCDRLAAEEDGEAADIERIVGRAA